MVSGFFTSPHDHERIRSGEASEILIASKSSGWVCWLKRFRRSFIYLSPGGAIVCWAAGGIWGRDRGQGTGDRSKAGVALLLLVPGPRSPASPFFQLHVDRQRADLLDQHVERFGHARGHLVGAVDDL